MSNGRRVFLVHSKVTGPCEIEVWRESMDGSKRLDGFQNVGQIVGPKGQIRGAGKSGFGACCVWHNHWLLVAWSAAEGVAFVSGRVKEKRFECHQDLVL